MVENTTPMTSSKLETTPSKKRFWLTMPILTHVCAWGFFVGVMLYSAQQPIPPEAMNYVPQLNEIVSMMSFVIFFFYINYAWLIPHFYYRRGLRPYLMSLFMSWLAFAFISSIAINIVSNEPIMIAQFLISIMPFGFLNGMGFAIRLVGDKNKRDRELRERENEALKSELSFLRSQISPHFLFNIMNSIVSMSRVKPELVEPTLIQLSQLMRYMLYESDEKKVPIEKEIDYLENYISLQKMRFGTAILVLIDKKVGENAQNTEGSNFLIEPMLLIPFVENAFKHGVGMIRQPIIKIDIELDANRLIFNVVNKFNKDSEEEKDFDSGIGLKNVKRRLELVYGHKHTLKAEADGDVFVVNLTIDLQK
jgi:two-component system, LytTR family, sensor kinase